MVLVCPMRASIRYWGVIKIWLGSIICTSTILNSRFLQGKFSLAKAYPAMELNTTAQITRSTISSAVLIYRFTKGRLCSAVTKFSSPQWEGRICGGIAIDSACVLKQVNTIHTKGKIITMLPRIRTA